MVAFRIADGLKLSHFLVVGSLCVAFLKALFPPYGIDVTGQTFGYTFRPAPGEIAPTFRLAKGPLMY